MVGGLSRARNPPRARAPEADPGLEKGEEGTPKKTLGSAGLWRPRGSLVPASSDGTLPAAATTALRDPLRGHPFGMTFGVPLAPYGRARLVVAGGRMSSGPPVRRLAALFGKNPAVEASARVACPRAPAAAACPPPA